MENLYNKASLVLTPQMVETGKVYSMKPEDRKGDFTFSRSTAATRVNASGNIEKETGNLLTQSNTFSSWSFTTGSSVTGNQAGYDGTNDAWLLTDSGNIGSYAIYNTINDTGILTASIYAKAASTSEIELDLFGTPTPAVKVDLISGNITSVSASNIDAKSVDVGNGWYRISLTCNISSLLYIRIGCDGAGSIYIQDAQLEQGLVARDVITTTTTAIYGGITDNAPRLDYTDSSCPALLLEPQRTNLVTQSEYFGDSVWSKQGGISVAANNAISPSGYTDASKIELTATDGKIQYQTTGLSGTYTFSVFAKKGNHNFVYIFIARPSGNITRWINLDNGSITNGTGTAEVSTENYGDDWYKIIYTFEGDAAYTNFTIEVADNNSSSGTIGDNIYIYGAQAELGSYATSYIPTYGSAVTRNGEVCGDAGNASTFNSAEGVLCLEIAALADDLTNRGISITDGTSTNRITFLLSSQSNTLRVFGVSGALQFNLQNSSFNTLNYNKIAVLYQLNNFKFFVNGTQIGSSTSGAVPIGLNSIVFDNGSGGLNFYGKTKQVLYFPTALSDEELAALTTIG